MSTPQDPRSNRSAQSDGETGGKQPSPSRTSEKISDTVQQAKQAGKEQLDTQKDKAAEQVQQLAGSLERAGATLEEEQPSLASYTRQIATRLTSFSDNLRTRTVGELLEDTEALARRNPGVFLVGSVAVGVALARFLKAQPQREDEEKEEEHYGAGAFGGTSSDEERRANPDVSTNRYESSGDSYRANTDMPRQDNIGSTSRAAGVGYGDQP